MTQLVAVDDNSPFGESRANQLNVLRAACGAPQRNREVLRRNAAKAKRHAVDKVDLDRVRSGAGGALYAPNSRKRSRNVC